MTKQQLFRIIAHCDRFILDLFSVDTRVLYSRNLSNYKKTELLALLYHMLSLHRDIFVSASDCSRIKQFFLLLSFFRQRCYQNHDIVALEFRKQDMV